MTYSGAQRSPARTRLTLLFPVIARFTGKMDIICARKRDRAARKS